MRTHAEQCNVPVSDTDFKVLAYSSGASDLRIMESLYIFKEKPSLNAAYSFYPLEIVNR